MRSSPFCAGVLFTALALCATPAAQADEPEEPYLGEISLFAGNFAPQGWAFCDGQTLAISENDALFSLLGTTYRGDGSKDFKLPDLRKTEVKLREDAGIAKDAERLRYIIALEGIHPAKVDAATKGRPMSAPRSSTEAARAHTEEVEDVRRMREVGAATTNRHHMGQVVLFASTSVPQGWALCEGQALAISGNDSLFSLLGTTYGGDGKKDFKLPDLRKAELELREDAGIAKDAAGLRYIVNLNKNGVFPSRDRQTILSLQGEIALFAGNFAVAPCDGTTVPLVKNTALYALLSTTYGGDRGKLNFKLPDLRKTEAKLREDAGIDKDAKGLFYIMSLYGKFPARP
jgi:microcystin-dependent protein